MTSHEEVRKARLEKIKRTLDEARKKKGKLDKDRFIAMCCMEWGSSKRTVIEYFKIVELAND